MPSTHAAIYARISSDPRQDGLGVARQVRECRRLAAAVGASVVRVYVDDDCSAFSSRSRPGYELLLSDLASGEFSLIIAWHPDRLYRRQRDLMPFIDAVQAANAHVATVCAGVVDLSTAAGRMTARIVGAVAEHESDHLSQRIIAKLDELATHGAWGGGIAYGYRSVGKGALEVDPLQAEIIRECSRRVLSGESLRSICRDLDRRGVPTARGGLWRHKTVRQILTGTTVRGMLTWHGQERSAAWDPILAPETADLLRSRLGGRSARCGRPRNSVALLTGGILRCGHCQQQLYLGWNNGLPAYLCEKPPSGRGCGRIFVAAEPAERTVVDAIANRISRSDGAHVLANARTNAGHSVARDETSLRQLAAHHAAGSISRAEWSAARAALEASIRAARIREELRSVPPPLRGLPRDRTAFVRAWSTHSLERRRAIIASLITRIDVQPSPGTGCRFNTARVLDGIRWSVPDRYADPIAPTPESLRGTTTTHIPAPKDG